MALFISKVEKKGYGGWAKNVVFRQVTARPFLLLRLRNPPGKTASIHLVNLSLFSIMRKILFAFSALTLVFAFSFCAKEPVAPVETSLAPEITNQVVSDRSPCDVTITATGQVRVCGLATLGSPCNDCMPTSGIGQSGTTFNYNVNSPNAVPFTITNLTQVSVDVTIVTSLVNFTITIKPGECKRFSEYECAIVMSAQ